MQSMQTVIICHSIENVIQMYKLKRILRDEQAKTINLILKLSNTCYLSYLSKLMKQKRKNHEINSNVVILTFNLSTVKDIFVKVQNVKNLLLFANKMM